MKFGIVLPTWLCDERREALAVAGFKSLSYTKPLSERTTLLLLVRAGTEARYTDFVAALSRTFDVIIKSDKGLHGTEQTLAWGSTYLVDEVGVDYVVWMGDDALFHTEWLQQLEKLIQRRPQSKSWSVYRSNHKAIHSLVHGEDSDIQVRSICGHCMTVTAQEWKEWGVQWGQGNWSCGEGDTLDLVHVVARPGERWVTAVSYVQHTGWEHGVHCTGMEKEYAQDFQYDLENQNA